ncbi:MAG TPA: helix-turn-helix transcriptional regulator [Candidatus Limnocylindrales bacterium]|nr:helix-turn-helix transcriptional regulator [Candidatus Limnocylindrales bacterium]
MRRCDTPEEALGAVITDLRLKKQWSYHHVSSLVRCDPSYMNDIEHGKQNPTFGVLRAIADVHGIKLSRLIAMGERRYERHARKKASPSPLRNKA